MNPKPLGIASSHGIPVRRTGRDVCDVPLRVHTLGKLQLTEPAKLATRYFLICTTASTGLWSLLPPVRIR
ncbi:MAG: hypothetical protein JWR35_37 [Marmoricola sp.]|nr:hypothetical protein [Marmoricola sp.]